MHSLEERIRRDGVSLGTEVLKVDTFLNHQIDVEFLTRIGQEFARLFSYGQPQKILTMESSGIACAVTTAQALGNLPVVFAKKTIPSTLIEDMYSAEVRSFTKGVVTRAVVATKFLSPGERVLIIDDFLAHGEAATGLLDIAEQAGCQVVGYGAVIEKQYQGGGARIRSRGVHLESLAVITGIKDNEISFA